jgi:glycine dehydrogenase subunit 2
MLIFQESVKGRQASLQAPQGHYDVSDIPVNLLRTTTPLLPEVSELQVVRHFTRLSEENFAIDRNFYPLGSCTMKYNPKICAGKPGISGMPL